MSVLLTTERAAELLAMPKRLLRESELAWHYVPTPAPVRKKSKKRQYIRPRNAYHLKARLIEVGGREIFLLTGTKNGSFSFTLKWGDYDLARIDCGERHHLPKEEGERDRYVYGPHVHYYVAGYGLDHAYETRGYSFDDVNGALAFFLRHCNIVNPPALQEVLRLG